MLANALLTASLTGDPSIVLGHVAQDGHSARLIQPAPTSPNDASVLVGLFDDGVSARPDQYRDI